MKYMAADGTTFATEQECRAYEENMDSQIDKFTEITTKHLKVFKVTRFNGNACYFGVLSNRDMLERKSLVLAYVEDIFGKRYSVQGCMPDEFKTMYTIEELSGEEQSKVVDTVAFALDSLHKAKVVYPVRLVCGHCNCIPVLVMNFIANLLPDADVINTNHTSSYLEQWLRSIDALLYK